METGPRGKGKGGPSAKYIELVNVTASSFRECKRECKIAPKDRMFLPPGIRARQDQLDGV
eukprot:6849296-Pyramimonas_sp.AAC.1